MREKGLLRKGKEPRGFDGWSVDGALCLHMGAPDANKFRRVRPSVLS